MAQKKVRKNTKGNGSTAKSRESPMSPEERRQRIESAAYLRAERRGFENGSSEQDWIEAEHEVDAQLNKR